jgi:hypothetical protein
MGRNALASLGTNLELAQELSVVRETELNFYAIPRIRADIQQIRCLAKTLPKHVSEIDFIPFGSQSRKQQRVNNRSLSGSINPSQHGQSRERDAKVVEAFDPEYAGCLDHGDIIAVFTICSAF